MTDKILKQNVLDELAWEPSVNAAHIGVTARDGVVTLTGHVCSYTEKLAAERATGRVSGVKAVAEELEVRYLDGAATTDEDIAKRAIQSLAWDVSIPDDKVKIKVEKGWVTLTGNVDWHYQKHDVESHIRKLQGVMGVFDNITIKPTVHVSDVRSKIVAAFGRSAEIDADDIIVTSDGGKVTLSGDVATFSEKWLAQSTAWSAPGVTQVENLLTVN